MKLNEVGRIFLHSEIKRPQNKKDGFSDDEIPATNKVLAQSEESSKAAFAVVQVAGERFWTWWNEETPILPFP